MYHDVVPTGHEDTSGFPGRAAALYKVTPARFEQQMAAVACLEPERRPTITFDDGGASAMHAANELERHGLRGAFFITVNYIGRRGFVTERDVRELYARGHLVGSHSCSHPLRMAHCPPRQLLEEWSRSRAHLSTLIGDEVRTGSIPGGGFSPAVAAAAQRAGLTQLFTSEPTGAARIIGELTVNGRFSIRRRTSVNDTIGLATGAGHARVRQQIAWTIKKASKRLGGAGYLELRRLILDPTLK